MHRRLGIESCVFRREGSCAAARAGGCSHRLLEFEHELVDRLAARRLDREVARILGVAPEIAFGDEFESGGLDFAAQRAFLDAVEALGFAEWSAITSIPPGLSAA